MAKNQRLKVIGGNGKIVSAGNLEAPPGWVRAQGEAEDE